MQDAFAIEKDDIGNWDEIGYSAPGKKSNASSFDSQNFAYSGNSVTAGSTTAITGVWVATPKNKLNDCTTAMSWSMSAQYIKQSATGNSAGNVKYTDGSATTSKDCLTLTPAWKNLFSNS